MYLLDTNIVSYWMRGDLEVIRRLREQPPSDLALSAITLAEILYGITRSSTRKVEHSRKIQQIRSVLRVYPFDDGAAEEYAEVRSQLEATGHPISERDTQIAAIALAHRLTVVTHNVKEFGRVAGLAVEDWALPA
jgi:tRNA(fMet)-specific endonuclease VapC